jgi:hypothetical protein
VAGRGTYETRLPARTTNRGQVCWNIQKTSDAGTLRVWVEQSTFFGIGNLIDADNTTTAPHGTVAGCVE